MSGTGLPPVVHGPRWLAIEAECCSVDGLCLGEPGSLGSGVGYFLPGGSLERKESSDFPHWSEPPWPLLCNSVSTTKVNMAHGASGTKGGIGGGCVTT